MANLNRAQEVRRINAPPPTTWNTRDPLTAMGQNDAIILDDLIPETNGLMVRPGYVQRTALTGTNVTFLKRWFSAGGERLIASIFNSPNNDLYDITSGSTLLLNGSGGNWKAAQFAGTLGLVNGADQPQQLVYTNQVVRSDLAISGITTPERLSVIHAFKGRGYYATGDEAAFYYAQADAFAGQLTRFPIDRVSRTGGNVIEISSWTVDGGSGVDDFFVLFLDTGEVLVYQGDDPGDANSWAIVGRYALGVVRAVTQFGGKLHVVTDFDYAILPDDLQTQGLRRPTKLSGAARAAVAQYGGQWQIFIDTARGWRLTQVPSGNREQHLLHLRTGGIARFHYPANVWEIHKGELLFGGSGGVFQIEGTTDDGAAISWAFQQAFVGNASNKWVERYRPIWTTPGDFTFESGIAFDYDASEFTQNITTESEGTPWDTSQWDTSEWTVGGTTIKNEWMVGMGRGGAVSLLMNGSTTTGGTYHGTDLEIR